MSYNNLSNIIESRIYFIILIRRRLLGTATIQYIFKQRLSLKGKGTKRLDATRTDTWEQRRAVGVNRLATLDE